MVQFPALFKASYNRRHFLRYLEGHLLERLQNKGYFINSECFVVGGFEVFGLRMSINKSFVLRIQGVDQEIAVSYRTWRPTWYQHRRLAFVVSF